MLASNDQAEPGEQAQMQEVTPLGMHPHSSSWHAGLSSRAPSSTRSRQPTPCSVLSDQPKHSPQPQSHDMEVRHICNLMPMFAPGSAANATELSSQQCGSSFIAA